ncbi:MAG: hypothetical protein IJY05_04410 [Clostridia bacterium]|nr:hypothetical protein [Clostridia bacterium]
MFVQPKIETYRFIGEVASLNGQSMVECRLPGSEISSILAVEAKTVPTESVCADGEVKYGGKVMLTVVYEDGDRKVCRAERGVEFFHKAEGKAVTPACFAKTALRAENVAWRREGSGLYFSVIVGAEILVYGGKQMEYLTGGEGMIIKTAPITVHKSVCVTGETDGEDEFDSDYVGDVLLHSERAMVYRVEAEGGQIELEGEIALNICVLTADERVCSYERLTPFRMQVPCDEAFGGTTASARVQVKSAYLTVGADEEKGKSKIVFSYTLAADCFVHVKEEIEVLQDGYSVSAPLTLHKKKGGGRYLTNVQKQVERVSGVAAISPAVEGEIVLQAAVLPRVEISCKKTENGFEAEGAALAEIIFAGGDGSKRSVSLSLPFAFPLDAQGDVVEADGLICAINVRRKRTGEIEAEGVLKLCVRSYANGEWEYVSQLEEGEAYEAEESAFSVYLPGAGADLWSVAKKLRCSPEELEKSNPDLKFPLSETDKIYVYRQIR